MSSQTVNLVRWNRSRIRREACKPRVQAGASIPQRPCREFIADLTIEEPQGDQNTILPFNLWPEQEKALATLQSERLVIFLKARQLGITWLILAYLLWLCMFKDGTSIIVFSKGGDEAKELIRRVKGMYERYKGFKPRRITNNKTQQMWSNGSRIIALPATEAAGRSFTASVILFDEYAFMEYGSKVYAAAKPTIDNGGKMFIVSTADDEGDDFHTKWKGAEDGSNGWFPVFLAWHARPDRDLNWYKRVEAEFDDPTDMLREYPSNPEEAFTPRTSERFISDMMLWDRLDDPRLPRATVHEPMVLALDAGVSGDLFAAVGVTRHPNPRRRDTAIAVRLAIAWTPQRGQKLNFIDILNELKELIKSYDIIELVYDPYQLHLMSALINFDLGVPIHELNQGKPRIIADKGLLDLILSANLAYNGLPKLREHIDNANRQTTEDKRLRIIKRNPKKKIDLVVALSMASYRCLELPL